MLNHQGPLSLRALYFQCTYANSAQITRTHQQIADELGTAREVVSRQLKRLELKGSVTLGRGQVDIINRSMLEKLAHS
jgi:CRP/FNR family transcriptional regulator